MAKELGGQYRTSPATSALGHCDGHVATSTARPKSMSQKDALRAVSSTSSSNANLPPQAPSPTRMLWEFTSRCQACAEMRSNVGANCRTSCAARSTPQRKAVASSWCGNADLFKKASKHSPVTRDMAIRTLQPLPSCSTECPKYCGIRIGGAPCPGVGVASWWKRSSRETSSTACCNSGDVLQRMSFKAASRRTPREASIASPDHTSLKEPRPRTAWQRNSTGPTWISSPAA
mmetsp:Transcript_10887/g.30987  ORF Transcript_10887/g.30987 Transcript_10887/m.30987 type:complete len:232 (+) Transcript_10887:637-1332(+)